MLITWLQHHCFPQYSKTHCQELEAWLRPLPVLLQSCDFVTLRLHRSNGGRDTYVHVTVAHTYVHAGYGEGRSAEHKEMHPCTANSTLTAANRRPPFPSSFFSLLSSPCTALQGPHHPEYTSTTTRPTHGAQR